MLALEGSPTAAAHALRPPSGPKTVIVVFGGPIPRVAVPALCAHVRRLLDAGADLVTCDVSALANPDLDAIDTLAHVQLTALRQGRAIRLRNPRVELQGLLALTGLDDALRPVVELRIDPRGKTEEWEELRVDEEVDSADPPV
jgi:ABC-type transporter Mla MlaB component